MISLGVDISTRKIAIGGIREDGSLVTRCFELDPGARGGRRLVGARTVAYTAFSGHSSEACIIVVEAPIHRAQNQALLGIAYVTLEAAQSACPGAVVMDCPPATWKKEVLGHGRADKNDALTFAANIGYTGTDDDVADALCLAQLGWDRWLRAEQLSKRRAA